MIDETVKKIEANIRAASVSAERKQELLKLLGTLKSEVANLSTTHGEQAQRIADFAESSAHEATSAEKDAAKLDDSLGELKSSVREFESSHPKLVQIVNAISHQLSNLGI